MIFYFIHQFPDYSKMAERVRFELTTRVTPGNGFRDRRIRPLCHLSLP